MPEDVHKAIEDNMPAYKYLKAKAAEQSASAGRT